MFVRQISGFWSRFTGCAHARPERRTSPRVVQQLPVLVLNLEDALDDPYLGRIVDYSHGGICLELPGVRLDEGTVLGIRPPSAYLMGIPHWAQVQVCYYSPSQTRHGCRFLHRRAQSPRRTDLADADATKIDILGFAGA
jgi:hypothetical protein